MARARVAPRHLDVGDDRLPRVERGFDGAARHPVQVAVNDLMFEQFIAVDHVLEFFARDVMMLAPFLLAGADRAGGGGGKLLETGVAPERISSADFCQHQPARPG